MIVFRDEARIERLKKASQYVSAFGFLLLVAALILGFVNPEQYLGLQVAALPIGWLLSQIGLYLAHRYLRKPRPDEVLDEALRAGRPDVSLSAARAARPAHAYRPDCSVSTRWLHQPTETAGSSAGRHLPQLSQSRWATRRRRLSAT